MPRIMVKEDRSEIEDIIRELDIYSLEKFGISIPRSRRICDVLHPIQQSQLEEYISDKYQVDIENINFSTLYRIAKKINNQKIN